ncbi:nucleotidyltransferase domain-containing protein, partial [Bacillus megaterium]|nr:nucleotidyltransferase domain-containing protein [Priestia megaterium]
MAYFAGEEDIQKSSCSARGTARYNSDIDLCIDYIGKQKWKIKDDIDEIVG